MKVKSTAALLVALAAALGSCGGDDAKPSASRTAATGATGVTQPADKDAVLADRRGHGRREAAEERQRPGVQAERRTRIQAPLPRTPPSATSLAISARRARRAPRRRSRTSPRREREKLHKDLYTQGKNLCSAYTPAQLAQQYNIQATRAEDVARAYAELYEQGNPSLVLPYQQGCLAGFKKRARKTRNAGDGTGG